MKKEQYIPTVTPGISVGQNGHLYYDGADTVVLAEKYGSPFYLMSENTVRANCRRHLGALRTHLGEQAVAAFASKAFSCRQIYRIIAEEGMYTDVVSCGELYTAVSAGFDASHILFHGNNKTPDDIEFAIENKVGFIVADNMTELDNISAAAANAGITQTVLLRLTPGIDPHTHEKICTGKIDSKFGSPIENGQAEEITLYALSRSNIKLAGFHYHIGSQIAESDPFTDALDVMLGYLADMRAKHGYTADILNIGGGFGIRYVEQDKLPDYDKIFSRLGEALSDFCGKQSYPRPFVITEPGRSIVADAGITLYTVGSVKTIPAYRTYVAIDGGMTDNPRYTLYEAEYLAVNASHADREPNFVCCLAGRCCESGDVIIPEAKLAQPAPGDIVAVLNTGAYNYSMASNYNRIPRLPVVMLRDGADYLAVRRETFEDITSRDI